MTKLNNAMKTVSVAASAVQPAPAKAEKKARRVVSLPERSPHEFKAGQQVQCEMKPKKYEPVTFLETRGKFHYVEQKGKKFRVWLNKLVPMNAQKTA